MPCDRFHVSCRSLYITVSHHVKRPSRLLRGMANDGSRITVHRVAAHRCMTTIIASGHCITSWLCAGSERTPHTAMLSRDQKRTLGARIDLDLT